MFHIMRSPTPYPSCLKDLVLGQPTSPTGNNHGARARTLLAWLALWLITVLPGGASAQTPLSNTPVTEAQLEHLFTSNKPVLYYCQTGVYDDLGNLDGSWGEESSPGRITSAAWDIGGNRYLYAYQLSNPNWLEGNDDHLGGWDVALDGFSTFRVPLRHKHVVPVDFDGDEVLDTSFRVTDHACNTMFVPVNNDCTPFTGPFAIFTAGTDDCAGSWTDYYYDYGGVSNDAIASGFVDYSQPELSAHFAVQYDPKCCAYGVFRSTQVFGFVTDAPPAFVDGVNLGGASASIRIVAPVPRVLLVQGICGDQSSWDTFAQTLSDSGFVVKRFPYGSPDFSEPPGAYVGALADTIDAMQCDKVAVVAHSMGGLIARDYMKRQAGYGPRRISQLVTLGTPNHGSDLYVKLQDAMTNLDVWFAIVFPSLGLGLAPALVDWVGDDCKADRRSARALADMRPGSNYLNELNYGTQAGDYDQPGTSGWGSHADEMLDADAYYASVGGTQSICYGMDLPIWNAEDGYHANDGVVAGQSATLSNLTAFRAYDVDVPTGQVTHAPGLFMCGVPYYLQGALGSKVARILLTSPASPPVLGAAKAPNRVSRQTVDEDVLRDTPAIVDSLAAGVMDLVTRAIPATELLQVMLASTDARLTLRAPDGTIITPDDTSTVNGIAYLGQIGSGLEGYRIANPLVGTWTFRIDGTTAAGLQYYGCLVAYASAARAVVSTGEQVIHEGGSIQVRAELDIAGVRQTSVGWASSLLGPNGAVDALALMDDGKHGDGQAGDGVYGAVAMPADGLGLYRIGATATIPDGESFSSSAACELAHNSDLSIAAEDISCAPNLFNAGDNVTVSAIVRNVGDEDASGVKASVRDRRTGVLLGTATLTIPAGGQVTIQAPWQPAAPDSHELEVAVSPFVFRSEMSYANNVARRTVILGTPVGVGSGQPPASALWLADPQPNPSQGFVRFAFGAPAGGPVALELFDVLGRRIRRWTWENLPAGSHTVHWNGRNQAGAMQPPGMLLCRVSSAGETRTRKLVLRP